MRKHVLLRLLPEHHEAFLAKAVNRDMPLTKWIIQACLAYEAKGARFGKKAGGNKNCHICGGKHDPQEHFGQEP